MLHVNMNCFSLMVYAQSIEESKFFWISRNFKMSGQGEQHQNRVKKRAQIHDEPSAPKYKL